MGQYYIATVIDESDNIETLHPHDFDNGAKLMEFSLCGNLFVNAVLSLIHNKRAKVAFIGDYADEPFGDSEDFYTSVMPKETYERYYQAAWSGYEKLKLRKYHIPESSKTLLETDTFGTYLVNHDRGEYIDIAAYIKASKVFQWNHWWAINPLPLLTACGNGLGGGDFNSRYIGSENVGLWAFATLEYTSLIPLEYKQVSFVFKEVEADDSEGIKCDGEAKDTVEVTICE